jgi:hypothetical protein
MAPVFAPIRKTRASPDVIGSVTTARPKAPA